MAKFRGEIGFGESTENPPGSGIWMDTITVKTYSGDVFRSMRKTQEGEQLNDDLSISNSVSIVADAFANDNLFAIRYVIWMGTKWKVTDVEVKRPRLILELGGVYNGPDPE